MKLFGTLAILRPQGSIFQYPSPTLYFALSVSISSDACVCVYVRCWSCCGQIMTETKSHRFQVTQTDTEYCCTHAHTLTHAYTHTQRQRHAHALRRWTKGQLIYALISGAKCLTELSARESLRGYAI